MDISKEISGMGDDLLWDSNNMAEESKFRAKELIYLRVALEVRRLDRIRNEEVVHEGFGMAEKAPKVNCEVAEWV